MTKNLQVKEMIFALLRQADGGVLPRVFRATPEILALVDGSTAQLLYEECADEVARESGVKFEWV